MKLLYITNGINGSGGLERVLSVKASALAEDFGYEISILCLNKGGENPFYTFSPKIRILSIEVGGNPVHYLMQYKKGLQRAVDHLQPDVISVCDDGLKAFFIPKLLKTTTKIIYERHVSKLIESTGKPSLTTRFTWQMMEYLGNGFDRFVLLTEGNLKEWPALKNRIVIANPLPFSPKKVSTLDSKTVICVGKISYQKGQDLLVQTQPKGSATIPRLAAASALWKRENRDFLDVRNAGYNIHFFPPDPNIELRYLESSVYVMSSRFEGFGMVLIEAMACGLPCVSFNCDYGPSDIIENGVDGILVEKENASALAEKLILLIEDSALRKTMGKKAREHVKRYEAQEIVRQWDVLFREL